jgi:hypothetical protein
MRARLLRNGTGILTCVVGRMRRTRVAGGYSARLPARFWWLAATRYPRLRFMIGASLAIVTVPSEWHRYSVWRILQEVAMPAGARDVRLGSPFFQVAISILIFPLSVLALLRPPLLAELDRVLIPRC